ncbi:TPA: dUTP diphosphatase [Staphylococcus aureus]
MKELQVKTLSENAILPERNHATDAGFDIYVSETVILKPQEKAKIATDIAVNIPKGYVGLLTSRSGVSSKTHLVVETGKIDAGFQGHMKIIVKNDSPMNEDLPYVTRGIAGESISPPFINDKMTRDEYLIRQGDKLAQLVIVPIVTPEINEVKEFDDVSERGQKGFGSSGV